ncbi:hypothetical protein ABPG72_004658 [Tetrahymena utriculariae]
MQFQLGDNFQKDQNGLIQQTQPICENNRFQTVQSEIKKQGQLLQITDIKTENRAQSQQIQQIFISENKRLVEESQNQCISQISNQNADEYIKRVTINENEAVVFSSKIFSEQKDSSQINRFLNDSEIQVKNNMKKLEDNLIERKLIINTKYQNIMFLDLYKLIPSDETKMLKLKIELMEQQHKQELRKIYSQQQNDIIEKNQLKNELNQYEIHIQQLQQVINNLEALQMKQNHETHTKFVQNIELKDIQIQQLQQLIEQKQRSYEEAEKQMKLQLEINDCLRSQLEHFVKYQQAQQQSLALSPIFSTKNHVQKDIIKFEDTQNSENFNIQYQIRQNMQTFISEPNIIQNKNSFTQSQSTGAQQFNPNQTKIVSPIQQNQVQWGEQINQQKTINSQICNFQFTHKQEGEKPEIMPQFFNQSESSISRTNILTKNISQSLIPQKISQNLTSSSNDDQALEVKHQENVEETLSYLSFQDDIISKNGQQILNQTSYNDNQLQGLKDLSVNNDNTEKPKHLSASNSEYEETKSVKQSAKNVPKNFIKAFKSFMNSVGEKLVIQNLKNYKSTDEYERLKQKLNNIVKFNKINNEMIIYLIQNEEFTDVFYFFLRNRGTVWIEESQIKDKEIHSKYLERYIKAFTDNKYLGKIKINQKKNHKPIVVPDYCN